MTDVLHIPPGAAATLARAGAWLVVGGLLGAAYFLTLRGNVALFASGRLIAPIAIQLARFTGVSAALTLIAMRFGALALLAAAAGIIAARTAVLRQGAQP